MATKEVDWKLKYDKLKKDHGVLLKQYDDVYSKYLCLSNEISDEKAKFRKVLKESLLDVLGG